MERKSDDPSRLCAHGPHLSHTCPRPVRGRASCEEFGDGHAACCALPGHDDGRLDPSAQTLRPDQHPLLCVPSLGCKWRYSAQPKNFCIGIESQRSNFPSRSTSNFAGDLKPCSPPLQHLGDRAPPFSPTLRQLLPARVVHTLLSTGPCCTLAQPTNYIKESGWRMHTHAQATESYSNWVQGYGVEPGRKHRRTNSADLSAPRPLTGTDGSPPCLPRSLKLPTEFTGVRGPPLPRPTRNHTRQSPFHNAQTQQQAETNHTHYRQTGSKSMSNARRCATSCRCAN